MENEDSIQNEKINEESAGQNSSMAVCDASMTVDVYVSLDDLNRFLLWVETGAESEKDFSVALYPAAVGMLCFHIRPSMLVALFD